jgi:ubiquitin thioesterase OTU1
MAVLDKIAEATGVAREQLELALQGGGFPPQATPIRLEAGTTKTAREALGVANNDLLIVSGKKIPVAGDSVAPSPSQGVSDLSTSRATRPVSTQNGRTKSMDQLSEDEMLARAIVASLGEEVPGVNVASGVPGLIEKGKPAFELLASSSKAVVRRIVPDDNSCLFSSIGYCVRQGRMAAGDMRALVAQAVVSDPLQWNEAILGKDPVEYAAWILDSSKWGGAIELTILSQQLAVEISAFDVQTQRVDTYGEGNGYGKRILVIYDGLHYDALALAAHEGAPERLDETMFTVGDVELEQVLQAASSLVCRYHDLRQYTDTSKFLLRCGVCQVGLTGESEAMKHAQATGHQSFTEY